GAVVTKQGFEQALKGADPHTLQLLIDHPRREESPFIALIQYNRADLVRYVMDKGEVPNREHLEIAIRHGALDVVQLLTDHGISSDNALSIAVEHRQWGVARYFASQSKDFYGLVELCRSQSGKALLYRYPPIAFAVELGLHDVAKFLIDNGESVQEATPDLPVWWEYIHDWDSRYDRVEQIGMQQGQTPLEIAIKRQDSEMVRILTTYSPENRAIAETNHRRYVGNVAPRGDIGYWSNDGTYVVVESLLSDALKTGNQEIIDLVIKAYSDPEKLYAERTAMKNPETMRSWIYQNVFLWKGEKVQVPDSVLELFMENEQGLNRPLSDVAILLQHGWIITRQELEQALVKNDPQMLQLLIDHPRMKESPFILLAEHNRADLASRLIEQGNVPAREHLNTAIKHGALETAKKFIETGVDFVGALTFAAEQKQKAIVEYLLTLPISAEEIKEAHAAAYRVHAYDIMELLERNR
ncbi:MAG: hypothetical protein JSR46_12535, partial [Verrucomicrobia bacterium]|nr:hypothetical protein [Verrucomicrobiota bacterium]